MPQGPDQIVLVPGRASQNSLVLWVESNGFAPVITAKAAAPALRCAVLDLRYGMYLAVITGLEPATDYAFDVRCGDRATTFAGRTLAKSPARFVVATGSCFALGRSTAALSQGYRALLKQLPVDLRVLVGDQIYLDYDPATATPYAATDWSQQPPTIEPMARYRAQWRDPRWRDFMAASPTMALGDDHEFWNDFPRAFPVLEYSKTANADDFRRALDVFQSALNVSPKAALAVDAKAAVDALLRGDWRTTSVAGAPVSMFMLDARSRREPPGGSARFCTDDDLRRAGSWLAALDRPGMLFVGQPLSEPDDGIDFVDKNFDSALRHYPAQFKALCDAIAKAPHDVLVVSGDVHWSRLRKLDLAGARAGGAAWEFVCSGLTESVGALDVDRARSGAIPFARGSWSETGDLASSQACTMGTLTFEASDDRSLRVEAQMWQLGASPPRSTSFRFVMR